LKVECSALPPLHPSDSKECSRADKTKKAVENI